MCSHKIGILTFHDTTNFGAILQAVATYKVVAALGFDCEIINYHNKNIDKREVPEIFLKNCFKNIKSLIAFILRNYKLLKKHRNLLDFLNKESRIGKGYFNKFNIKSVTHNYDTILIGSDMLWNTNFTLTDYTYMLDFADYNMKKFAFATSIGPEWQESEKTQILPFIERFNMIALREKEACLIVGRMLHRNINWVCDPTMLIEPEEWLSFTTNNNYNNYVLVYMDDTNGNCLKAAKEYARKNNVDVRVSEIRMNFDLRKKGYKYAKALSIQDFLSSIKNSDMLFTASYHGMLFAIYFHIPFVYFNKDSSRLNSVAERLGLLNRNGNLYKLETMGKIDWFEVDRRREEFKFESLNTLKEMLTK